MDDDSADGRGRAEAQRVDEVKDIRDQAVALSRPAPFRDAMACLFLAPALVGVAPDGELPDSRFQYLVSMKASVLPQHRMRERVYEMARDGAADGRPLIVFTFSDFDPAGRQIPVSIGRKLQALRDFQFPGLRGQVVPVSLTLEQVLAERLPTTPVKESEGRAEKWDRAFGPALRAAGLVDNRRPAQVEIDALASIRPDALRRITLEKIAPYRDETLERRTAARAAQWQAMAQVVVDAQIDDDSLADIRHEADAAADDFNTALASLVEAQERLRGADADLHALGDEISVPEPPDPPAAEIDASAHEPLIDLDWSFEDGTAALRAHKRYGGEGEDSEEAP